MERAHRENDPLQSRGRIQKAEECSPLTGWGFKASAEFSSPNLELVSLD